MPKYSNMIFLSSWIHFNYYVPCRWSSTHVTSVTTDTLTRRTWWSTWAAHMWRRSPHAEDVLQSTRLRGNCGATWQQPTRGRKRSAQSVALLMRTKVH